MSKLSQVLPKGLVGPCFRSRNETDELSLQWSEGRERFEEPKRGPDEPARSGSRARDAAQGESLSTRLSSGGGARN